MKIDIHDEFVYVGAGILIGQFLNKFNILNNTAMCLSNKAIADEKEARRVIDVMGDTIEGVEFINGRLCKT